MVFFTNDCNNDVKYKWVISCLKYYFDAEHSLIMRVHTLKFKKLVRAMERDFISFKANFDNT